jgi:enterochelin esterase-like enzyme
MKKFQLIILPAVILILLIIIIFSLYFYSKNAGSDIAGNISYKNSQADSVNKKNLLPKHDTDINVDNRKVIVKTSGSTEKKGTILVLHGWNLPPEEWCTKTTLCEKASELGYFLVLPDMGRSNYQRCSFPETRNEWRNEPGRFWIIDTLIPFIQKEFSLLWDDERNFIVGLSTGARGVALVILDEPKLFKGAAALSGDYDQSKIPDDNIYNGFYGPYNKFKKRWDTADNAVYRIKEFNTPFYLGHGKLDKVCPPEQTKLFYDSLIKYHPKLQVELNMPDAGHDYNYWDSEVDNILKFFEGIK